MDLQGVTEGKPGLLSCPGVAGNTGGLLVEPAVATPVTTDATEFALEEAHFLVDFLDEVRLCQVEGVRVGGVDFVHKVSLGANHVVDLEDTGFPEGMELEVTPGEAVHGVLGLLHGDGLSVVLAHKLNDSAGGGYGCYDFSVEGANSSVGGVVLHRGEREREKGYN